MARMKSSPSVSFANLKFSVFLMKWDMLQNTCTRDAGLRLQELPFDKWIADRDRPPRIPRSLGDSSRSENRSPPRDILPLDRGYSLPTEPLLCEAQPNGSNRRERRTWSETCIGSLTLAPPEVLFLSWLQDRFAEACFSYLKYTQNSEFKRKWVSSGVFLVNLYATVNASSARISATSCNSFY